MRISIALLFAVLFISGCSGGDSYGIIYNISTNDETNLSNISIGSIFNNDTMDFGRTNAYRYLITSNPDEYKGEEIKIRLWIPETNKDADYAVLLIPGIMGNTASMYPIAVKLLQNNIPVAFLAYRGVEGDLMADYEKSYGLKEIQDGIYAIDAIKEFLKKDKMSFGIFGVSLGGVIALNIANTAGDVKILCIESMPCNLKKTASKVSGNFLEDLMIQNQELIKYENYSPLVQAEKLPAGMPVYAYWDMKDELIDSTDINDMVVLMAKKSRAFSFDMYDYGVHQYRYGFPLTKEQAYSINDKVAVFFKNNLLNISQGK